MLPSELEYYVQKRREGWDNSQVRKELKRRTRMEDVDITFYVSQIDDLYIEAIKRPENRFVSKSIKLAIQFYSGVVLVIVGCITIYFSFENKDILSVKVIGVLLLGGSTLIINSRRRKRKLRKKSGGITINRNHKPKSFRNLFFGDW